MISKKDSEFFGNACFHFHPDQHIDISEDKIILQDLILFFVGAINIEQVEFEYCPEFNKRIKSICAVITFESSSRTLIKIKKRSKNIEE